MSHDQVLFVGPDLSTGSASETFRQQLLVLRGPTVVDALIDTATGFDALWLAVRRFIDQGCGTLLLIDLDPSADSAYLDWLRSELAQLAGSAEVAGRLFVSTPLLGRQPLSASRACVLIEQGDEQASCAGVADVAAKPDWSRIPPHRHQLFLCIGARCVRRGALPLWKHVRQRLATAAAIETADGVLITRTHCQYPCNRGPIATVHPAGHWYQVANLADADRLVDEQLLAHRPAEAILIARQP